MPDAAAADLVNAVLSGSPQAAARMISLVENNGAAATGLLRALFPHTGRANIIGITGPPGSGKSTLVNAAIRALRERGDRVGVIAVDPTSPFTGGALLGDRIRMQDHSTDPEVFVRSMATRGSLGGLAPSTADAVSVLDAWGAATILVETVGTGQAEVDVVTASDTVVVVTMPGMGDSIQTLKAGVMEIADLFVINKADRPEADRTLVDLKMALAILPAGASHPRGGAETWHPPILSTVATTGQGIAEMLVAIESHRRHQEATGARLARRRTRWRRDIVRIAEGRLRVELLDGVIASSLDALVDQVAAGTLDPHAAAERLLGR